MRLNRWLPTVFALAFMLVLAADAAGCPGCREAVAAQPGDAARLKDGYFWSILFMIGAPFSMLGTGAFLVARAVRRGAFPEM